jgi:hypothetical protein
LSCLLDERKELLLRDILYAVNAVLKEVLLLCLSKRREDAKIERLEKMNGMRETKRNNIIFLTLLYKRE